MEHESSDGAAGTPRRRAKRPPSRLLATSRCGTKRPVAGFTSRRKEARGRRQENAGRHFGQLRILLSAGVIRECDEDGYFKGRAGQPTEPQRSDVVSVLA